jgi:hypothetical protein
MSGASFSDRLKERIAVLNEVLEDVRELRKEWDHLEIATQVLTALEKSLVEKVEATAQTWRERR